MRTDVRRVLPTCRVLRFVPRLRYVLIDGLLDDPLCPGCVACVCVRSDTGGGIRGERFFAGGVQIRSAVRRRRSPIPRWSARSGTARSLRHGSA